MRRSSILLIPAAAALLAVASPALAQMGATTGPVGGATANTGLNAQAPMQPEATRLGADADADAQTDQTKTTKKKRPPVSAGAADARANGANTAADVSVSGAPRNDAGLPPGIMPATGAGVNAAAGGNTATGR